MPQRPPDPAGRPAEEANPAAPERFGPPAPERFGPLLVRHTRKADGRALTLYEWRPVASAGAQAAPPTSPRPEEASQVTAPGPEEPSSSPAPRPSDG